MTLTDITTYIDEWNKWASSNNRYDVALLKIWTRFENFLGDMFVKYATGQESETGYKPQLKLVFQSEEHLNAFMRDDNKTYIDYLRKLEKYSKHIFINDPFEILFIDSVYANVYKQIGAIRNYIAHESLEAKRKVIQCCFNGDETRFLEPERYLLSKKKSNSKTYYSFYIESILHIIKYIVSPPST